MMCARHSIRFHDVLNYVIALHTRLRVDIPEIDYPKLLTIAGATAYLGRKLGSAAPDRVG